jgi:hypothetical protein
LSKGQVRSSSTLFFPSVEEPSGIKHILMDTGVAESVLEALADARMLNKGHSVYLSPRAASYPRSLNYTRTTSHICASCHEELNEL